MTTADQDRTISAMADELGADRAAATPKDTHVSVRWHVGSRLLGFARVLPDGTVGESTLGVFMIARRLGIDADPEWSMTEPIKDWVRRPRDGNWKLARLVLPKSNPKSKEDTR